MYSFMLLILVVILFLLFYTSLYSNLYSVHYARTATSMLCIQELVERCKTPTITAIDMPLQFSLSQCKQVYNSLYCTTINTVVIALLPILLLLLLLYSCVTTIIAPKHNVLLCVHC